MFELMVMPKTTIKVPTVFFLLILFSIVNSFSTTNGKLRISAIMEHRTVADIKFMSVKEVIRSVCGNLDKFEKFNEVDIVKSAPTVCKYVVANPKAFFENPRIAKFYGFDIEEIDMDTPLDALGPLLPVIYVADVHQEYGTLGFILNKLSDKTMQEVHPSMKSFRSRSIYLGGLHNKGSSFTMLHRKVGFPENR